MVKLEYSSNNSGGSWWLDDEDWKKLEAAGWKVNWVKDDPYHKGAERWLGCLAKEASKEFETPDEGIEEWKTITGQDPWAEGCNCCGVPHNFSYEDAKGNTHYPQVRRENSFDGWG
jgi:hypothetical protein